MDWINPPRNGGLLQGCLKYRQDLYNSSGESRLRKRLLTDFGFGEGVLKVVLSRRPSEIRRVDQVAHGLIDCLLLALPEFFIRGSPHLPLIKRLVKKTIVTAIFNVQTATTMWKQFTVAINHRVCESQTQEAAIVGRDNIFGILYRYPPLWDYIGKRDKKSVERTAHLVSTRHMPVGNVQVELKALQDFQEITTSVFPVTVADLSAVRKAAYLLGRRARKAGSGDRNWTHLSLAGAGSLYTSIRDGGRAREIVNALQAILTHVPDEDKVIHLPWIDLKDVSGVPRWCSWCRKDVIDDFTEYQFMQETEDLFFGCSVYRAGLDEALGDQILACAYWAMLEDTQGVNHILCRTLTIPEPGGKERIVTTSTWWLYILEQPVGFVLRQFLTSHPSAEPGMRRTDQAWQYLRRLIRAKDGLKEIDFASLSSDLKSATDVIPREVLLELYDGYLGGIGYTGPLLDINRELLTRGRLITVDKTDSAFVTRRGVCMGEPLAKPLLTLLNLVAEELAIRSYQTELHWNPIQVPWRAFAVAGDDHIATGPVPYLNKITEWHMRLGSIISKEKHSFSKFAVRYCEKYLIVENFCNEWTLDSINNSTQGYEASPFVDSIKVRLISPCSKGNESFNDRNTAVGKGKSLGNTLRWLNADHFDSKWVRMVRDRFFLRMGALLPDSSSGVYWHLLLPEHLGGLGLWLDSDMEDLVVRIPDPTKSFILQYISIRGATAEQKRLFKGFTSNSSYRGYTLSKKDVDLIEQEVLPACLSEDFQREPLRMIARKYGINDLAPLNQIALLQRKDWFTEDNLKKAMLRPFLFQELITGEAKPMMFNTISFKRRYSSLWDLTFAGHCTISTVQLKEAMNHLPPKLIYYVGDTNRVYYRGSLRALTLLEEMFVGLPDLRITQETVGILTKPYGVDSTSIGDDLDDDTSS